MPSRSTASIGNRTRVKGQEQARPPFRQAEFDILYGKGVNLNGELVDIGADMGLVREGRLLVLAR